MSRQFPRIDRSAIRTTPLAERRNKVHRDDLSTPYAAGGTFADWLASLPRQFATNDFRELIVRLRDAHRHDRVILAMFGAHVIKVGLGPLLIDMMGRGVISAVATNGAGAIHDFELALIGGTSEDVPSGLETGEFGMSEETGRLMNVAIGSEPERGMGWLLGRAIAEGSFLHADVSVLAAAYRLGVPATIHVAIGTDIIHQHPAANGAAIGAASFADFEHFTSVVAALEGGAVLNIGSAVVMPEVFLKALTIARNLGHAVSDFTAADFDMIRQYRPAENVVSRPTRHGGRGLRFTGSHELLIPLVIAALTEALSDGAAEWLS